MTIKQITEKTALPISLVVLVLGIVWWASGVDREVKASAETNVRQDRLLEEVIRVQSATTAILERVEKRK